MQMRLWHVTTTDRSDIPADIVAIGLEVPIQEGFDLEQQLKS